MARNKYKKYDWEAIEAEYRLGQLSVRIIAEKYKIPSHSMIIKRATKYGWLRNESKKVNDLTRSALVKIRENEEPSLEPLRTTPTREDIEAAALTNIQVITQHRQDIRAGRTLVNLFMEQLQDSANARDVIEQDIVAETEEDQTTVRRNSMLKAVSLPSQAGVLRDLSVALKNFIPLERQAYNITDEVEGETYEQRLMRLANEAKDV